MSQFLEGFLELVLVIFFGICEALKNICYFKKTFLTGRLGKARITSRPRSFFALDRGFQVALCVCHFNSRKGCIHLYGTAFKELVEDRSMTFLFS